ncbi:MAG: hypothetical protein ABSG95_01000 [Solirubrobacteraceae bacterium]|jgi:hypothetical protein
MHSPRLQAALTDYIEAAASRLRAEIAAGAEIPFELGSAGRRGASGTPLYCYRSLTDAFIAEREPALERLPSHAEAARLLESFDGLERYLSSVRADSAQASRGARAGAAMRALLADVFHEQSDFDVRPERLRAALGRLERSAVAGTSDVTVVATLHGMTITSEELQLTKGLRIAQPDTLEGLPEEVSASAGEQRAGHLILVFSAGDDELNAGMSRGREVLRDLLRALRLFGDARLTLGALAWARIGTGVWHPLVLGAGGRPHGMLVVTSEQEDELRAFCNLVSRREPHANELAWALRRFELGCERESYSEALTDHLLALRALLEPEGPSSGLLAGRLAALCATPEQRFEMTERIVQAIALERATIAGTAVEHAGAQALAEHVSEQLRALLRDVICGHLAPDLAVLADELLLADDEEGSAEEVSGDPGEPEQVLDVLV